MQLVDLLQFVNENLAGSQTARHALRTLKKNLNGICFLHSHQRRCLPLSFHLNVRRNVRMSETTVSITFQLIWLEKVQRAKRKWTCCIVLSVGYRHFAICVCILYLQLGEVHFMKLCFTCFYLNVLIENWTIKRLYTPICEPIYIYSEVSTYFLYRSSY